MFKRLTAACVAAAATAVLAAPPAYSTTADVHVRIEGTQRTMFDRVIRSGVRNLESGTAVRATSDDEPHTCDGTNNDMNPAPSPTATGASVTAMETLGATFDGNWTPGFDDYFITAFGDEREDNNEAWWWGILINRLFTAVGGCQYQVADGDEVLWVNDAFSSRPYLWLAPVGGIAATDAVVGEPYEVSVGTSVPTVPAGSQIGDLEPEDPYAGATVSQVDLTGNIVASPSVGPAMTSGAGVAALTFTEPGWHRVKARHQEGSDHPIAVASNSIDVCVRAGVAAPACDGPAPSQVPLIPGDGTGGNGGDNGENDGDNGGNGNGGDNGNGGNGNGGDTSRQDHTLPVTPAPPVVAPIPPVGVGPQLTAPLLDRSSDRRGRIGVRWSITSPGVGVQRWVVESRLSAARPSAPWTARATGAVATSASLRLPAGRRSDVRFSVTDTAGRTGTASVGDVLVPLDDRAKAVKRGKKWKQKRDTKAWMGRYSVGSKGASLRVRIAAGKPVVFVRGVRKTATIELRIGKRTERFTIKGSTTTRTREVTSAGRTAKAGTLTVRVVKGSVGIDGVAAG